MAHLAAAGGTPLRGRPYPAWPRAGPEELEGLRRVLHSGRWSSSHGTEVREFEVRFAAYQDAGYGVCVHSGEAALRLPLVALGLGPGDEVVLPAYTFVASATAVVQAGGVPVFADVDPRTLCLDPAAAEGVVSERTVALMPVHLGGLPADMGALGELARRRDLVIVEDAAQGWGGRIDGRGVGALGAAGAFSFQASKNISAGEGGIVLTESEETAARCRSLADCGRTGDRRYHHSLMGGNFRMTEFQGAILRAQLDRYPAQLARRRRNASALLEALASLEGVTPQAVPPGREHAWHLVPVRVDAGAFVGASRATLVEALVAEGVPATGGYPATPYDQPLFREAPTGTFRRGACPVAEAACGGEVIWFRQNVLLGDQEDALDAARALEKLQRHAGELAGSPGFDQGHQRSGH